MQDDNKYKVMERYYSKMKIIEERRYRERIEYERTRGNLCVYCLNYHQGECDTKTCFKCGKLGHLVSQCLYKFDKLTCFKCGKKGHKIYDCQILIVSTNVMSSYGIDREPLTVENQKRNWMREEIKRGNCVECSSIGHLYCSNEDHQLCRNDGIYSSRHSYIGRDIFSTNTYAHYQQFRPDRPPVRNFEESYARFTRASMMHENQLIRNMNAIFDVDPPVSDPIQRKLKL